MQLEIHRIVTLGVLRFVSAVARAGQRPQQPCINFARPAWAEHTIRKIVMFVFAALIFSLRRFGEFVINDLRQRAMGFACAT